MEAKRLILFFVCIAGHTLYAFDIHPQNEETSRLGYGNWYNETDGELSLMQRLIKPEMVVFDIGANLGDWSLNALKVEPTIDLYAFEPLPRIVERLRENLQVYPNARVFETAISDRIGGSQYYFYMDTLETSALSGFYYREVLRGDKMEPLVVVVQQDSLDRLCKRELIETIDFLKIDTEGAEWRVLQGAKNLIREGKITAIQFEYGGCYLDAKTTLKQVYDFLSGNGYLVFRIFPEGLIHVPQWDPSLENYDLSNYFAIQKDKLDLITNH